MGNAVIDERGRIVIPKDIRDKFGLREGTFVQIDEISDGIKISAIRDQNLLKQLKGCIKTEGKIDPLKVKQIWQM